MNRLRPSLLSLLAGLFVLAASNPASGLEVRRIQKSIPVGELETLRLQTPLGNVILEESQGDRLLLEAVLSCTGSLYPCEERAAEVELAIERQEDALVAALRGPSKFEKPNLIFGEITLVNWWRFGGKENRKARTYTLGTRGGWELSLNLIVRYPAGKSLEVLVGKGSVEDSEVLSNLKIEVREGNVRLAIAGGEVGSVSLRSKVGRVALYNPGRRNLAKKNPHREPRKVSWTEGTGKLEIDVRVKIGNATVQLR